MKITLDTQQQTLTREDDTGCASFPLYSDAAFDILSQQWLRVGWNQNNASSC